MRAEAEGPASFSRPTRTNVSMELEPVIRPGGEGDTAAFSLLTFGKKFGGGGISPFESKAINLSVKMILIMS